MLRWSIGVSIDWQCAETLHTYACYFKMKFHGNVSKHFVRVSNVYLSKIENSLSYQKNCIKSQCVDDLSSLNRNSASFSW